MSEVKRQFAQSFPRQLSGRRRIPWLTDRERVTGVVICYYLPSPPTFSISMIQIYKIHNNTFECSGSLRTLVWSCLMWVHYKMYVNYITSNTKVIKVDANILKLIMQVIFCLLRILIDIDVQFPCLKPTALKRTFYCSRKVPSRWLQSKPWTVVTVVWCWESKIYWVYPMYRFV